MYLFVFTSRLWPEQFRRWLAARLDLHATWLNGWGIPPTDQLSYLDLTLRFLPLLRAEQRGNKRLYGAWRFCYLHREVALRSGFRFCMTFTKRNQKMAVIRKLSYLFSPERGHSCPQQRDTCRRSGESTPCCGSQAAADKNVRAPLNTYRAPALRSAALFTFRR